MMTNIFMSRGGRREREENMQVVNPDVMLKSVKVERMLCSDLLSPEVRSQARPVRYGDVVQLCCRHVGYHGINSTWVSHAQPAIDIGMMHGFFQSQHGPGSFAPSEFVTLQQFFHPNVPGSIYVLGCMLVPGGLYIQRSKLVISMGASSGVAR